MISFFKKKKDKPKERRNTHSSFQNTDPLSDEVHFDYDKWLGKPDSFPKLENLEEKIEIPRFPLQANASFENVKGPTGSIPVYKKDTGATSHRLDISSSAPRPKRITNEYKELLKKSIVISTDFYVETEELDFICKSHLDGSFIYRYVGRLPFRLDIPYQELISLDNLQPQNEPILNLYADYLSEQIDLTISYTDYLKQ